MAILIGLLNVTLTATWHVFNRAAVAEAYAEPAPGRPGSAPVSYT
jgi:hypothetical protein